MTPAQTEINTRESRFSRFVRRTWKPLLVVIVVLVVIHGIATMILGRRFEAEVRTLKAQGEPVSTAELGGPKVPDDQNAAVVYAKVFYLLKEKETRESSATMENLLKSVGAIPSKKKIDVVWTDVNTAAQVYRQVVPVVQEALSRPKCQFPVNWQSGPEATFPHYAYFRNLTRMLSALAVVDAHDGKLDDAYTKIELAFQVAKAAKDEPILISALVTISCTQTANGALQAVLKYGQPSSLEALKLNNMLSDTDFRREWANGIKGERAMGLWMFNYLLQRGAAGYGSLMHQMDGREEPSAAQRVLLQTVSALWRPMIYADAGYYLRYMAANVASSEKPYRTVTLQEKNTEGMLAKLPRYAILTRTLAPIFTQGSAKVDEARANTGLTQLLLAALQYKSHNGAYPETVSQLRSTSSWDIPMDPFSGKEFVYKRTSKGFVAYSIGTDLKDDGGRPVKTGKDYDKGGDIVLDWER